MKVDRALFLHLVPVVAAASHTPFESRRRVFVIEGAEAITQFRRQYWDPLWRYSARLGFTVHNNGNVT